MPYSQIKRLLNKKGWTGKEIGQLLIASLLNDIKQKDKEEKELLFTQKEFEDMESTLRTDRDFTVYGVYRDLYSSLVDSYNRGQALYQQFSNGYYHLFTELREVQTAEDALKIRANTPLIVTESQYKRMRAQAEEKLRAITATFDAIVIDVLRSFMDADEAELAEQPAIKEALEATKRTPAEGYSFLEENKDAFLEGYYTLPDGRRSDQMTSQAWREALEEYFLKEHSLTVDGSPASIEETVRYYNQERLKIGYELFFKGADAVRSFLRNSGIDTDLTDEELEEAIDLSLDALGGGHFTATAEELLEALGFDAPTEWHYYEELPKDLTLYDLLDMYEEKDTEQLQADAPELYGAIVSYVKEKLPKAKKRSCITTWGELADAGVIGYTEHVEPTNEEIVALCNEAETSTDYAKRVRARRKGIAIIQDPTESQQDEETGDYIEAGDPSVFFFSLYDLENNGEKLEELLAYKENLIEPALAYIYSFNALLDVLGDVYDLPDLPKTAKLDLTEYEEKVKAYNTLLYMFYYSVTGDEEERKHKRAIIKEAFSPIEPAELIPSQDTLEEIREELTKLGLSSEARRKLKYLDPLVYRLMYGM